MDKAVSNAGPLIHQAEIGEFELYWNCFDKRVPAIGIILIGMDQGHLTKGEANAAVYLTAGD